MGLIAHIFKYNNFQEVLRINPILTFLVVGYFLHTPTFLPQQTKPQSRKNKKQSSSKKTTTKKFKKKFILEKNTPKNLKPEDIAVNINAAHKKNNSNYFINAILWAHYQACKQGLLKKNAPAPWEQSQSQNKTDSWSLFLNKIKDEAPTTLLQDIGQLKALCLDIDKNYNQQ